jgi:glycosyltransferase involved in cell wall biosynthesis
MSNSQPLVSIALCTDNGAAYLFAQLYTLVNQTYSNIEIIAVDDNRQMIA